MAYDFFCVISSLVPEDIRSKLAEKFRVIPLPPDCSLPAPVAAHPDMIFSVVGDKLITHEEYYGLNGNVIDEIVSLGKFSVVLSSSKRGNVYPMDVGFNAAVSDKFIVCRTDSTAKEVLDTAESAGIEIISVRQGYAGCSAVVAGDIVLTSDIGIHKALSLRGYRSYFAEKDGIILPGYDTGFIGGCAGYADGVIYFCGDPLSLPCADVIRDAARESGISTVFLSDSPLTDYGGLKFYRIK